MIAHAALRADDFLAPTRAVEHHAHKCGKFQALSLFQIPVDQGKELIVIEKAIVKEQPCRQAHDLCIEPCGILISGRIQTLENLRDLLGHIPVELSRIRADRHDAETAKIVDALVILTEVVGKPFLFKNMTKCLILLLKHRRQPALGELHGRRQKQINEFR